MIEEGDVLPAILISSATVAAAIKTTEMAVLNLGLVHDVGGSCVVSEDLLAFLLEAGI